NWGFYTFLTQTPRYFQNVLRFDIKKNGLYSSLPYLSQALIGWLAGYLSDLFYRKRWARLQTLRKACNTIGFIGPAICLLLLTRLGPDNSIWCVILFTVALGINGSVLAGFQVTHVDMSPTFASSLLGLTNCIANFAGILAPYFVGEILTRTETSTLLEPQSKNLIGWIYVFYIAISIYLIAAIIFLVLGSNQQQKWDRLMQTKTISET
ncbi:hypothetical protein QR98_0020970, partial [Sarcoptes scabiei]